MKVNGTLLTSDKINIDFQVPNSIRSLFLLHKNIHDDCCKMFFFTNVITGSALSITATTGMNSGMTAPV